MDVLFEMVLLSQDFHNLHKDAAPGCGVQSVGHVLQRRRLLPLQNCYRWVVSPKCN